MIFVKNLKILFNFGIMYYILLNVLKNLPLVWGLAWKSDHQIPMSGSEVDITEIVYTADWERITNFIDITTNRT